MSSERVARRDTKQLCCNTNVDLLVVEFLFFARAPLRADRDGFRPSIRTREDGLLLAAEPRAFPFADCKGMRARKRADRSIFWRCARARRVSPNERHVFDDTTIGTSCDRDEWALARSRILRCLLTAAWDCARFRGLGETCMTTHQTVAAIAPVERSNTRVVRRTW
jgi:hypothetical protein